MNETKQSVAGQVGQEIIEITSFLEALDKYLSQLENRLAPVLSVGVHDNPPSGQEAVPRPQLVPLADQLAALKRQLGESVRFTDKLQQRIEL